MVSEAEMTAKDEEIYRLQQLLTAADARISDLDAIFLDRLYSCDESVSIPTGATHNGPVLAEEEKPYRRGYSQGFSLCRQFMELASKNGSAVDSILDVLVKYESRIMAWRFKATRWERGQIVRSAWPPDPRDSRLAGGKLSTKQRHEILP